MRMAAILLLAPIVYLSAYLVPVSQSFAGDAWKISLTDQLKKEKKCDVKSLSRVKEFKLAGKDVVDGRAHCEGGVDYDFSWIEEKQKFDLRRCQPVVC